MPSHKDGIMVILSSPSGAGKTTLVNLLSQQDNFNISISHTTRKPRPGELADKDYYFVNFDEFKRLALHSQEINFFDKKGAEFAFTSTPDQEFQLFLDNFHKI